MYIIKAIKLLFKRKKTDAIIITILLAVAYVMITMMGLWAIDISTSAMVTNKSFKEAGLPGGFILTNGFRNTEPVQMYHYAMWLLVISNFAFIILFVHIAIAHFKLKIEKERMNIQKGFNE